MTRLKIPLDPKLKASLKDASVKLTGAKKRAFMAKATQDYFNGSPRQAETYMGWSRKAVATGLKELETGLICQDNHQGKGRKKTEEKTPQLAEDIRSIVDDKAQAYPQSLTVFCYVRISARAVKEALIAEKGYRRVPKRRIALTSNHWKNLKENGLSFQEMQKVKLLKKVLRTDVIFVNLAKAKRLSESHPKSPRFSIGMACFEIPLGNWAENPKWKGIKSLVKLVNKIYTTEIILAQKS